MSEPEWYLEAKRRGLIISETGMASPAADVPSPARSESEKAFMWRVINEAEQLGWLCYHTFNSMRSQPGFPDLVMVRAGRMIFAELKSAKGKLEKEQKVWLEALRATPAEVYCWRPADWSEIQQVLGEAA
jgi:hypothetical protein